MDPLSITASIIAVLSVVGKILSTFHEYSCAVKNAPKVLSKISERIKSLEDVLITLKPLASKLEDTDLAAQTQLAALNAPLALCLKQLKALEQKLALRSLDGQLVPKWKALILALRWKLKEKDTEKTLAIIQRFLNLALSVDMRTSLSKIEDLVRRTQGTSLHVERGFTDSQASFPNKDPLDWEKTHTWLSAPDPSSNYHEASEQRHEGTGVWFVESQKFAEWKNKPNSFLWLYGKPGCGKSILASAIIDDVTTYCGSNLQTAMAFFYFDFNDPEKQKCESMIRSLIIQLCSTQNGASPQVLMSLYVSNAQGKTQPTFKSLLRLLCEVIGQFQKVFIVLDALDECREREKLLKVIKQIAGWKSGGLHLLATSRKDYDIERGIKFLCEEQDRLEVQGTEVDNDIRSYIHSRIRTDHDLEQWQDHPGLEDEIVNTLIKKAGGMFKWVSCQLDSLKVCRHSPHRIAEALKSLPKSLDETYDRILCNIREEDRKYALRILYWLIHSIRPISPEELAEAVVNLDENLRFDVKNRLFPKCILAICSSLITVRSGEKNSSSSTMVKLAHCSVKEYLVSNRILEGPAKAYSIQEGIANACIAESCLAYLLQFDRPDSLTSQTLEDFPLALYAAESWIQHVWLADPATSIYPLLYFNLLVRGKEAFRNWVRLCGIDQSQYSELLKGLDTTCSSFCHASTAGVLKPVKLILQWKADVYAQSGRYTSAVDLAARLGYESVVEVLRDKRATIKSEENHNLLQLAIGYAFDDVMRLLFDKANAQSTRWRKALYVACFMKDLEVVQLLLEKRVEFDIQNDDLNTALGSAAAAGHTDLVQLLLENGADIEARPGVYGSALQMAIYWGHEDVARLLIDKGADINAIGGGYGSALAAASCGGPEGLVQLLLEKGANVNAHDECYGNALQTAIFFGSENVIRLLLEHGADVNDQGGYYGTPITAATLLDRKEVVELLFGSGADIGQLNEEALNKAMSLFKIRKCSESCMRRKLASKLNKDFRVIDCELCHETDAFDGNRSVLSGKGGASSI